MLMKNSSDTVGNRTHDLPVGKRSALTNCATSSVPHPKKSEYKFYYSVLVFGISSQIKKMTAFCEGKQQIVLTTLYDVRPTTFEIFLNLTLETCFISK